MVLTEPRLEQGAAGLYEMKSVGKFLTWIVDDVKKETKAELEASGLDFKQVQKVLSDKARTWYFVKVKENGK